MQFLKVTDNSQLSCVADCVRFRVRQDKGIKRETQQRTPLKPLCNL
jgi:hypothetical protein